MDRVKLEVRLREGRGGKDAREMRLAGQIPGVVYGGGSNGTQAIAVDIRALRHAVSGGGGIHGILDLAVEGEKDARPVLIKDLQLDPVHDRAIHVDFQQVRLDRVIQTMVAIHLEGTPEGVNMGGVLSQPIHEVNIEVLPTAVPEQLLVDITGLQIGDAVRLADIPAPDGVTFLDDLEMTVIASVTAPSVEEEPEPEEGEEGEEGAEGAEGAAAEEQDGGESEEPAAEE
jgi:large subunit ribosomal protein L25